MALQHHRTHKNQILDFVSRPWARALYLDKSKEIVVQKSSQCGISEWLIVFAIARAYQGFTSLYIGPTDQWCRDHVKERVNPTIDNTKFYQNIQGDTDNILFKVFNNRVVKFVGAKERRKLFSFVGDTFLVDEYDFCDEDNLKYAPDRLLASLDPRKVIVGNPTFEDRGIADAFSQSDQKEWHVRCANCESYQTMDFFGHVINIEGENMYSLIDKEWSEDCGRDIHVFCTDCGQPMNRLGPGKWIAKHPERTISGYHINRLFADFRPDQHVIADLWRQLREGISNPEILQNLYNSQLGLPYSAGDIRLDESVLASCKDESLHLVSSFDLNSKGATDGVVAGIDVGSVLNVKISYLHGDVRHALHIGITDFQSLPALLKDYNVDCAVIDLKPEMHKVEELMAQIPELYACDFQSGERFTEFDPDHAQQLVQIDRTKYMDRAFSCYKQKLIALPAEYAHIESGDFVKQMRSSVRKRVITKSGVRYIWDEGSKADHFRLTDLYEMVAQMIWRGSGDILTWLNKKTDH